MIAPMQQSDSEASPPPVSDEAPAEIAAAETIDEVVPADEVPFCRLDPRSVGLNQLTGTLFFLIFGLIPLIAGGCVMWFAPFPAQIIVPLVWVAYVVVSVVGTVWWPRWEHARWSYRVGDRLVELNHGVYWHTTVTIPRSRLQHVDVHRGPFERRKGLATLQLHTAGTKNAAHDIPGLDLDVALRLRDQLIESAHRTCHDDKLTE